MQKAVSTIARPIKVQDRHELRLSLSVVRFEGIEKRLCFIEIQGKERVRKNGSGFRNLEETNQRADGKPKVALVADAKDLPQDLKGLALRVGEIDDFFGFLRVFDLFLGVRFRGFEDPLGTIPHNQGKGDHGVDGIDREASQKEPILVGNHIS